MSRLFATLALLAGVLLAPGTLAAPRRTQTVVFIVSDGLRWQEVFSGAERALLEDAEANWTPVPELQRKFWHEDPHQRRQLLLPFIWGTIATHGQLLGNRQLGSEVTLSNRFWFSYPGYNEMASGLADPRIDRNDFGPNPNVTVYEWLNGQPGLRGRVEVFAAWNAFNDIFSPGRSHLPVRAGATLVDSADHTPGGRLLAELYRDTTRLQGEDALDSFVHVALRRHLQQHRPRVLFVSYGGADLWAHLGRYDAMLENAHSFDGYVADLWRQMQALPEYRGRTTFILTCDHGRGSGPQLWKDHGVGQPGSDQTWIAVMGPDTLPLGERADTAPATQAQLAATVAELLGRDYRAFKPAAAPSLLPLLAPR